MLAGLLIGPGELLRAAQRPHYGGTLRIETNASLAALDPGGPPLAGAVFECLVRLDDRGAPHPWLAVSWTHDAAHKRWTFTPRARVMLHNGEAWKPSAESLSFPDDRPLDRILADLARPRNAIVVRTADGRLAGTGPFSIQTFDAGKSLTLAANTAYWGGRPYLDSIEIGMGVAQKQQTLDLALGKADVIDAELGGLRRLRQQNANVAVSAPVEVIALVFDVPPAPAEQVQQAVALSIDRSAIQTVLLQRQAQATAALLPQWLSGYSFVFPGNRDLSRARELSAGAAAMAIGYDKSDSLLREIAERIAVNASEAHLALRATADGPVQGHVVRLRVTSTDRATALEDFSEQLKTPLTVAPESLLGDLYSAERALIRDAHVIPLVDAPAAWQLSPKVRAWSTTGQWGNTWLAP